MQLPSLRPRRAGHPQTGRLTKYQPQAITGRRRGRHGATAAGITMNRLASMDRVMVFGRGGAGESTFALELSQATGLPVIELDEHFWSQDLDPLPADECPVSRHGSLRASNGSRTGASDRTPVTGGQWWRYVLLPTKDGTLVRHSYEWGRARFPTLTIRLPSYPQPVARTMSASLQRLEEAVSAQ